MPAGLPVAIALLAQAVSTAPPPIADPPPPAASHAAYGPSEPEPPRKPPSAVATRCIRPPGADPRVIVVCAPPGFRLDPDVMTASREYKNHTHPKRPERMRDNSCASVGPFGCGPQAGINLVAAAVTAATMVKKAVSGENVGEMFVTDPQPSEYELYVEAKQAREAKEAAAAAKAKADKAAKTAPTPTPAPTPAGAATP